MKKLTEKQSFGPVYYDWVNIDDELWLDLEYRHATGKVTLSEVEWRKLEKMLKRKRKQLDKKG